MRELHGVAGMKKRNPSSGDTIAVRVVDGINGVELVLACCTEFAELTPQAARFLAKCLVQSAQRVEKENKV